MELPDAELPLLKLPMPRTTSLLSAACVQQRSGGPTKEVMGKYMADGFEGLFAIAVRHRTGPAGV